MAIHDDVLNPQNTAATLLTQRQARLWQMSRWLESTRAEATAAAGRASQEVAARKRQFHALAVALVPTGLTTRTSL